jgi:hypothetical protein
MKAILTIIIVLFLVSCQPAVEDVSPDPVIPDEPAVQDNIDDTEDDTPDTEEQTTEEEPVDEQTTGETDVEDPTDAADDETDDQSTEPEDEPVEQETNSTEDTFADPQMDPKTVVDEYLKLVTIALDEDDQDAWEAAYALVSPHSIKNVPWLASLSRYKAEADNTYLRFFTGNNVTGYSEMDEFGIGYKVYYTYPEGDVYYTVQYIDELYWVAQGSQRGSMYWRYYP